MVKFCSKCGNELKNENDKFCDKCGAEVLENKNNAGSASGTTVICPHCSQATPMGQQICAKCGASLEDNTTAVIVGYTVTFLLGIIGIIPGIYLLTRNNGKAKTQRIFIIGISITWIILNFIFAYWEKYLITIILIAIGIYLWRDDFSIF